MRVIEFLKFYQEGADFDIFPGDAVIKMMTFMRFLVVSVLVLHNVKQDKEIDRLSLNHAYRRQSRADGTLRTKFKNNIF